MYLIPRHTHLETPIVEQSCSHCEYDLTGMAPLGRLVRCPECGAENRIGFLDLDLVHPSLPPWWRLALTLGWPAVPWAAITLWVIQIGDIPTITGMVVLGGLVMFVALARATMIAFDCSTPGRRRAALSWSMLWAVAGSLGLIALSAGSVFSLWAIGMLIEHVRPK